MPKKKTPKSPIIVEVWSRSTSQLTGWGIRSYKEFRRLDRARAFVRSAPLSSRKQFPDIFKYNIVDQYGNCLSILTPAEQRTLKRLLALQDRGKTI